MVKRIITTSLLFIGVLLCGLSSAQDQQKSVAEKLASIKAKIKMQLAAGNDPSPALAILAKAKTAFDAGKPDQGESYLDAALRSLAALPAAPQQYSLPTYSKKEETIDIFGEPQPVIVEGYDDDCMEPLISSDGKYLFFNNSNAEKVDTHIHIAKRVDKDRFQHLGLLAGTVSQQKDMAPTMDDRGNVFFTSLRTYDSDRKSIYVGRLAQERLSDVHVVDGDIWPERLFWVDMDCCVSSDGKTLIISRARFVPGAPAPSESDLLLARLENGRFSIDPKSAAVLARLNTSALEYAPTLSHDGLNLYFTRAGKNTQSPDVMMRVMVASRKSVDQPFGEPKVIRGIEGFVEAPTVSADGSEIFFHKRVGSKFRLFHAYKKVSGS